jgi:hypothetical protein
MPTIEYEIKLNDEGRPCIDLPLSYEPSPEDKFFALEMARYFLQVTHNKMAVPPYDQNTIDMMDISIRLLGQVGDEMARILWHSMKAAGETTLAFNRWHVHINTIEERDAIPEHGMVQYGKLYLREEGLTVYVTQTAQRFVLEGGTTNDNWILMSEEL